MKIRALVDTKAEIPAWLEWRITNPFSYLNRYDIDARLEGADILDKIDHDTDILVLPRIIVKEKDREEASEWFSSIKSNGTKLVFDADDDIWSESYVSHMTKVFMNDDKAGIIGIIDELEYRRQDALWTLQQCDAVTVSTSALGSYVKTITNIPIYVVPNALNIQKFKRGLNPNNILQDEKFVTIGWAGAKRAPEELAEMAEAWAKVASKQTNVRFVVAGWQAPSIVNNKWLKDKIVSQPWMDTEKYGCSMQVDIGCCAVANTPFGQRKSPIKAWEYAIAGAAVVGSRIVYEKEPILLLADDVDDWYKMLMYYVDNESARIGANNAFTKHVCGYHDLAYEYYVWLDAYKMIVEAGTTNDRTQVLVS